MYEGKQRVAAKPHSSLLPVNIAQKAATPTVHKPGAGVLNERLRRNRGSLAATMAVLRKARTSESFLTEYAVAHLQRQYGNSYVQRVVASAKAGEKEIPPAVHDVLRSPGQQLDPSTRLSMESRYGDEPGSAPAGRRRAGHARQVSYGRAS
jgi:hypothetical protein